MSDRSALAWRRSTLIGASAALVLMPVGGAYHGPATVLFGTVLFGSGTLTTPSSTSKAISYDPDLAPIGAAMTATIIPTSEGSTAQVTVFGLVPNRGYAVSAYTKACGASPNAAGTRFRYHLDPGAAARTPPNPTHATPDMEISLNVRTDADGVGTSRINLPFTLTDRVPGSMVVHDETLLGARLACLTLSVR